MGKKAVALVGGSMIAGIFTYVGIGIGWLDIGLMIGNALAVSLDPVTRMTWQIAAGAIGITQTLYTVMSLFKGELFQVFFSAAPFFSVILLLWPPTVSIGATIFVVVCVVASLNNDA